jgi:hypothetical protein
MLVDFVDLHTSLYGLGDSKEGSFASLLTRFIKLQPWFASFPGYEASFHGYFAS